MRRTILHTLASVLAVKDKTTARHVHRVEIYSACIALQLDCSPLTRTNITIAAILHDIGKIAVSDAVLNKPGRFTDEEREEINRHAAVGGDIAGQLDFHPMIVAGVRHHHERWDGQGYPDRLKGYEIPFLSRVIAVADTFDACVEDRPYRKGLGWERAVEIVRENRGSQFCPDAVDAFLLALPDIGERYRQVAREGTPDIGEQFVRAQMAPPPVTELDYAPAS